MVIMVRFFDQELYLNRLEKIIKNRHINSEPLHVNKSKC